MTKPSIDQIKVLAVISGVTAGEYQLNYPLATDCEDCLFDKPCEDLWFNYNIVPAVIDSTDYSYEEHQELFDFMRQPNEVKQQFINDHPEYLL